jgi:hypothetical protein
MEVELDVFSGRPNPTWRLTPGERRELVRRVDRLSSAAADPTAGLGYRGFVLRRMDRARDPPWLRVGGGVVCISDAGAMRTWRDTEGIEAWLCDNATARGFGALLPGGRP